MAIDETMCHKKTRKRQPVPELGLRCQRRTRPRVFTFYSVGYSRRKFFRSDKKMSERVFGHVGFDLMNGIMLYATHN